MEESELKERYRDAPRGTTLEHAEALEQAKERLRESIEHACSSLAEDPAEMLRETFEDVRATSGIHPAEGN
jgi:hypothetical protein